MFLKTIRNWIYNLANAGNYVSSTMEHQLTFWYRLLGWLFNLEVLAFIKHFGFKIVGMAFFKIWLIVCFFEVCIFSVIYVVVTHSNPANYYAFIALHCNEMCMKMMFDRQPYPYAFY